MTKLSELLEAAVEELEAGASADELAELQGAVPPVGGWTSIRNMISLRAIAPALAEFVETKHAMQELDNVSFEYPTLVSRHRNAWNRLFTAMKEAGVTCE